MNISFPEIKSAVIALPSEEREELLELLLDSLNGEESSEIPLEAYEIFEKRSEEMKSGQVKGIPAEEVLRNLRRRER